jgi:hypothetical protein
MLEIVTVLRVETFASSKVYDVTSLTCYLPENSDGRRPCIIDGVGMYTYTVGLGAPVTFLFLPYNMRDTRRTRLQYARRDGALMYLEYCFHKIATLYSNYWVRRSHRYFITS